MDELLKQYLLPMLAGLGSAIGGYIIMMRDQKKLQKEAERKLAEERLKFDQEQAAAKAQLARELSISRQRAESDRITANLAQTTELQKALDSVRVEFSKKFEVWLEECENKYEAKSAEASELAQELKTVTEQRNNAEQKVEELKATIETMETEIKDLRRRVKDLESRQGISHIEPEPVIEDVKLRPKKSHRRGEVDAIVDGWKKSKFNEDIKL